MSTLALPTTANSASPSVPPLPGSSARRTPLALPTPVPANGVPSVSGAIASQRSPSHELKEIEEEEDADDEEDEGDAKKKKKGKKTGATEAGKGEYKYSSEISQMVRAVTLGPLSLC